MKPKSLLHTFLLCIVLLGTVGCGGCKIEGSSDPKTTKDNQSQGKKLVVLLHGLGSSALEMEPLKQYLQAELDPEEVDIIIPNEPDTFGQSIETQAHNLYETLFLREKKKTKKSRTKLTKVVGAKHAKNVDLAEDNNEQQASMSAKMRKATKVAFVCFSQAGPKLIAMRRTCAKAMKRFDKTGKKFVGDVFVACPLEGTNAVTPTGEYILENFVEALKERHPKLAAIAQPLETLLSKKGEGIRDMAPESRCTMSNLTYLKGNKIPMLAIAGDKDTLLKDIIEKHITMFHSGLYNYIDEIHSEKPNDLLVSVESAHAQQTKPPHLTRRTVKLVFHGPVPGIPNSSVFAHDKTLKEIAKFLKDKLTEFE